MKKIIYGITVCCAAFLLTGCGETEVKQTNESLHVHIGNATNAGAIHYAAMAFRAAYPDIPLEITESDRDTYEGINADQEKLLTDIMSGDGPDLFFLENTWDVDKLIEAGVLADLSQIYEKCHVFKEEDFIDTVMEQSVVDGKRYFIPYDFTLPVLLTTEEVLEETGFNTEKCTDFSKFMEESLRYINSDKNDRKIFRLAASVTYPMVWAGYSFVEDGEVVWDIEETRDYFNWYKTLAAQGAEEVSTFGDLYPAEAVRDRECIFTDLSIDLFNITANIRALSAVGTPVLRPFYNMDGGMTAIVDQMIGVRANSENMDNVQKFIEILFRKDIMNSPGAASENFSVRRPTWEEDAINWQGEFGQSVNGFQADLPDPTEEMFDEYYSFVDEIDRVVYNNKWRTEIRDAMSGYCTGEKTYEEAAEEAKKNIEFYLSE